MRDIAAARFTPDELILFSRQLSAAFAVRFVRFGRVRAHFSPGS
jgi:hypothetical protein